jgi:hypothetical protein
MPPRPPKVLAAAIVALGLAACAQSAPEAATPPASGGAEAPSPAASTSPTGSPTTQAPVLKDGRWPGYLKKIDGESAVTMDLVEFLTGEAAIAAWQKKYPDSDEDVPPNDYIIVNDNTKVRTLPVAGSVAVMVIDGDGATANTTVPLADLESQLDGGLSGTLIWFTVKKGEVTRLEEQFLP